MSAPRENSGGGRRGEDGRESRGGEREVFVISVAAEITGMHAQTLRTYDRIGLVTPQRTRGGGRRYSKDDIEQLQEIQRLSHDEGVNLAGIKTIIEQQERIKKLERENRELKRMLAEGGAGGSGAGAAGAAGAGGAGRRRGEIVHVPRSTAVVLWEQRRKRG